MRDGLGRADRRVIVRIVATYVIFSSLWIYLSDSVLGWLVRDTQLMTRISLFKGILFIALTSVLLYQLIARWVQESRKAERATQENRELLNAIIEGSSDAIYAKDGNGCYILFNTEASRITGKDAASVRGHDDTFIFPTAEAGVVMEGDRRVLAAGAVVTFEEVLTNARGELRTFLSTKGPIRDHAGKIAGLFGIARDITERKRVEEELYRAKDELEKRVSERTVELATTVETLLEQIAERRKAEEALQAETVQRLRAVEELRESERLLMQQGRLAAMGEMIGNIAHQWRQPLNALGLIIQQMKLYHEAGLFTTEFLAESVSKGMELIEHMSQTIDDFRNFYRPDKARVPFRVNAMIGKTVSLIEESFRDQHIPIEVSVDGDPLINGYPNEYSQVLLNILLNAKDVLTARKVERPVVRIVSAMEDGRAVVTISDNGGGIEEAVLEKIFDPYFTTKGPDKGTGIGLFMAKTIIEKNMHGRLTARTINGGAEFRVEV